MVDEATTRRVRRRRRQAGSAADSTVAEGVGVSSLNDEVERMASGPTTTTPLSETDQPIGSRMDAPPDFTPRNRMEEVRTSSKATPYEREYRLKLIHRMLMRNVPLDQIASELGVSVSTVIRDRKELFSRLREQARNLDLNEVIGDTLGFYKEVQGMGLRAASASKAPLNMRLAAMRTSLAAKNDMHRFLGNVGVYDVLRYTPGEGKGSSDMERLIALTESILGGEESKHEEAMQSVSELPGVTEEEEINLL